MKKEKSGYITVYLALLLGVLLSFVFTILEAVRVQTIRTQTEGTMDVGLFSIFGEFHRELLEQYDIFAIDTTYGEGKPDICKSEEHLQYYLNQNFENDKKNSFYNFRDLTNLHCDNVDFEAYMRTSDEEGQVLKRQIVEYMQEKKGIAWVETGVEHLLKLQEQGKLSRDVEREWNSANETVHSMVEERKKEFIDEETGEPMVITEGMNEATQANVAEAVVCAKRLRRAARVGALLCCVSSVLGLLLTGYLVFMSAYGSLSPLNLLLYLLLWLLPVWLLTAWAHRG